MNVYFVLLVRHLITSDLPSPLALGALPELMPLLVHRCAPNVVLELIQDRMHLCARYVKLAQLHMPVKLGAPCAWVVPIVYLVQVCARSVPPVTIPPQARPNATPATFELFFLLELR